MFKVNQKVTFGKYNQTDAVILRVNKKTLRVEITATRGESGFYVVGKTYSVKTCRFTENAFKVPCRETTTMQRQIAFESGVTTKWQADFGKTMKKFFK